MTRCVRAETCALNLRVKLLVSRLSRTSAVKSVSQDNASNMLLVASSSLQAVATISGSAD